MGRIFKLGTHYRSTKTLEDQAEEYKDQQISILVAQISPDIQLAYNLIDSNPTQAKTVLQDVIDILENI